MVPREGERRPRSWVARTPQERVISLPPFPIFLSRGMGVPRPLSRMPGGGQSAMLVLGHRVDLSVVDYL